jgi:hypothetical protein
LGRKFGKQQEEIEVLSGKLNYRDAAERKKEIFYQRWLADSLGGKHQTVTTGQLDLSTDVFDVEIKNCNSWMCGLQVLAYNLCTKVPTKVLALFDTLNVAVSLFIVIRFLGASYKWACSR